MSEAVSDTRKLIQTAGMEDVLNSLEKEVKALGEEGAAYFEALSTVPHLVRSESDPELFLKLERYHAGKAAKRISEYWKRRIEIFGFRARLAMDLSQQGSLVEDDVQVVMSGFLQILPDDREGSTVLFIDTSLLPPNYVSSNCVLRAAFFLLTTVITTKPTFLKEVVLLLNIEVGRKSLQSSIINLCTTIFPFHIKAMHIIAPRRLDAMETILPGILHDLTVELKEKTNVCIVKQQNTLPEELSENENFSKDHLPVNLGGIFSLEMFRALLQRRFQTSLPSVDPLNPPSVDPLNRVQATADSPLQDLLPSSVDLETDVFEKLTIALDAIPDTDKKDYLEAIKRCPDLISKESNPLSYLRFEKFDFKAAATRLTRYWEERKRTYGKDAFYPIISGSAENPTKIIGPDDLRLLHVSFVVPLPADSEGRPVILLDRSRSVFRELELPLEQKLRLLFLFLTHMGTFPAAPDKGVRWLGVLPEKREGRFDRVAWNSIKGFIKVAFPYRIEKIDIVAIVPRSAFRLIYDFLVPILLQRLGEHGKLCQLHTAGDKHGILEKLLPAGFLKSGLPQYLGGDWDFHLYDKWLEERGYKPTTLRTLEESTSEKGSPKSNTQSASIKKPSDDDAINCIEEFADPKRSLAEALELIPSEEKQAYLEAVEKCPDLVANESKANLFLQYDNFNAWAAAQRMVQYWNCKKNIFKENFILPVTQDGRGALAQDDIEVLGTGYLTFLPRDNSGRPVIFFDISRLANDEVNQEMHYKCIFYMMSTMIDDEKSYSKEFSVIALMYDNVAPQIHGWKAMGEILERAFPLTMVDIHAVFYPVNHASNDLTKALSVTAPRLIQLGTHRCTVHRGTAAQVLHELESSGFNIENLPVSVGGTWSYTGFDEWRKRRRSIESERYIAGLSLDFLMTEEFEDETPEERERRKRKMNIVYSRRKRERQRAREDILVSECSALQLTNDRLKAEHLRLHNLLCAAHLEIQKGDPSLASRRFAPRIPIEQLQLHGTPMVSRPPSIWPSSQFTMQPGLRTTNIAGAFNNFRYHPNLQTPALGGALSLYHDLQRANLQASVSSNFPSISSNIYASAVHPQFHHLQTAASRPFIGNISLNRYPDGPYNAYNGREGGERAKDA